MKHNILYIIDNLEFGGGERVFAQLINRLRKDKYKATVACLPTGAFVEKIEGSEVQINSVDMRNRFNPMVILRLVNLMKMGNVDIVHSQGARADFFARISARLARVPIVVSTVQMPVEGFDVNLINRLIYKALNRFSECFVDRFIVVSEALEKVMRERHKVDPQKVVTIYNGIEVDEYCIQDEETICRKSSLKRKLCLGNEIPIIGVIGRLVWQKGFEYFIEAIPNVLKKIPEAMFLIVGEGELREKLKVKSEKLKVKDSLIFTGFRDDIKEILASIDVFVIPSLLEGLPMILLEAMAMEKPIIATDIDGINDVLESGKTGLLVPARDPKALTDAIMDLLIHRDKAYQIGITARRVAEERFGVDTMVEKVEAVYQELLQLSGR